MSAKNTAFFDIAADKCAFYDWLYSNDEEEFSFSDHKKKCLSVAIKEELSDVQRDYFLKYHMENWTIQDIAKFYGTNKSTVSRTLSMASKNLARVLRYSSPTLLNKKPYHRNRRIKQ